MTPNPSHPILPKELIRRILRFRRQLSFHQYIRRLNQTLAIRLPTRYLPIRFDFRGPRQNYHIHLQHYFTFRHYTLKFIFEWTIHLRENSPGYPPKYIEFRFYPNTMLSPFHTNWAVDIPPFVPHVSKLKKPFKIKPL